MQEEKNTLTKTNKKNRALFSFLTIFLLFLAGLVTFVNKATIISSIKNIGFLSKSNQNIVKDYSNDNSVFKQLVSEDKYCDNDNFWTPEVVANLEQADLFRFKFEKYGDGEWDKLLEENQVALEVSENPDGSIFYTFVYSKNPNFKFENGDVVDFKPTVKTPKSLVVIEGITTVFGYEEGEFNNLEEDIFRVGDKIIFVCDVNTCEGGVTKWLLVYRD